jgi:hypothetical protein
LKKNRKTGRRKLEGERKGEGRTEGVGVIPHTQGHQIRDAVYSEEG